MNTTDDATDTTSRTTVETNNGNETHAHTTRIPHAQQRKPAMSYVLYFSKPFALAIAIWPFLSLLLTLPVLALLYHRDNRLRFTSALTAYLVVLYLIALACFTMYPMPENPATYCAAHHLRPQLNPFEFIHDIRTDGITGVMQLAMNVVFFLPLGYFMKRVFRWKFATALSAMFLTSLLIETTQLTGIWGIYPCAYRLFDVDDLITNTLGGILATPWEALSPTSYPNSASTKTPSPPSQASCAAAWRSRSTCSLSKRRRCPSRRLSIWLACCSM